MIPTRAGGFKNNYMGVRPWKRHSLVLLVAGLAYVAVGISYAASEVTPERETALALPLAWAPIEFWGAIWVFSGVLSIISSRWPPVAEKWGYGVLTGLSAGWSATYAVGVIFANAPASNLTLTFVWGLMAFMWWAVSGLVNPELPGETPQHGLGRG